MQREKWVQSAKATARFLQKLDMVQITKTKGQMDSWAEDIKIVKIRYVPTSEHPKGDVSNKE